MVLAGVGSMPVGARVSGSSAGWQGGKRILHGRGKTAPLPSVRSPMIYLDHNATSPLLPEARAAWLEATEQFPGNPSSPHRLGERADRALDDAGQRLAALLGCSPLDLIWTSG